mgnify:FL=1
MLESEHHEARTYDREMWVLEQLKLSELRQHVIQQVTGNTLEIGVGTGANVAHYPDDITVTAIDFSPAYIKAAYKKAHQRSPGFEFAAACADAQNLPFPNNTFDTVLGALVFCSIARPHDALVEVRRVLRPGGQLILLEHVRGLTPFTRRLTDWLHPLWFAAQGDCHLNRETAKTVAEAGFEIDFTSQHARGLVQVIQATSPET